MEWVIGIALVLAAAVWIWVTLDRERQQRKAWEPSFEPTVAPQRVFSKPNSPPPAPVSPVRPTTGIRPAAVSRARQAASTARPAASLGRPVARPVRQDDGQGWLHSSPFSPLSPLHTFDDDCSSKAHTSAHHAPCPGASSNDGPGPSACVTDNAPSADGGPSGTSGDFGCGID